MAHNKCGLLMAKISLFYMILHEVLTASVPVTWVPDSRFVCGMQQSIVGTFIYNPSSTTVGFVDDLVTVTYSTSLTAAPSRMVALGIVDFQFRLSSTSFQFYMVENSVMQTGFVAQIYSDTKNNVKNLKIAFITVDPSFTDSFSISYFSTPTYQIGPFSVAYYINFTASTGVTLNLTHSNGMLAFQHILTATSASQCFDLNIVFRIFNQSYYQVVVSSSCSMTMTQFGFSRIIFDKTAIEALGFSYFKFGELLASNGDTTPLTFSTSPFFGSNFMLGLKCFKVDGPNKLIFSSSLGTTTSISSTISFTYLSFMYWSYKLRQCPAGYPLFQLSTLLCYDVCPDGFYSNGTIYMCLPCSYTCQTCSAFDVCTNCDPATNRFQNGTTCPPSSGYFDNGTSITVLCSSVFTGCATCTSNTSCLSCNSSYYISGSSCVACSVGIANCTTCSMSGTLLTCSVCSIGSTVGFGNTSCVYNPCSDPYCISCPTNVSVCDACSTSGGYYLAANATCYTTCGDNFTVGTEQCDDGNNVDGDGCNSDCTIGNNNSCAATAPYIDPITGACTATAPSGYYADPAVFSIVPCFYTCGTCSNGTVCDTCSPTSNRMLASGQCNPSPGFFDNGTQVAPACVSPCSECSSVAICTACVSGSFLSGTSCPLCSTTVANCATCSATGTSCTQCQLGYIVNTTTFLCDVPCYDLHCLSCPSSMALCVTCVSGYQPAADGTCQTVCGDFVVMGSEVCDDGNSVDKDGCSSSCSVETDFTCEPDPTNATGSACFYVGQVQVEEVYIKKVDGQNQIEVLLNLSPSDLSFWDSVDFLSMIQVNSPVPITGYTITHNSDGTVAITIDYAQDLQGQSIDIQVNPAASGIPALSRAASSTSTVSVVPDDNKAAFFYDDSTYKMAELLSKVCTGIAAAAAVVCAMGLVSGKMIGVDMMAVVQISFFSLVTLSQLNPCFAALASLKLVNGYNSLSTTSHLQDPMTPTSPKGIFLFSRFTENFNFTLAIVAVPLLVALVSFILSKTALKENEKVAAVAKKAVGEYTLMGLLLGGYMIAVSSALEAVYGSKQSNDLIGKVSLAECALLLAMFAGYFVFLLLRPDFFGEFTEEFTRDRLSPKYYNFVLVERLLAGAGLVLLLSVPAEAALPIALFALTAVFVAVKSPHRENYQKYRVLANMGIAIAVEAVYMAYRMTPANKQQSPAFIYMPFIVCGLLAICVIQNAALTIISIHKMFKGQNLMVQIDNEQKDELSRLRKQTMVSFGADSSPRAMISSMNTSLGTRTSKQSLLTGGSFRKQLNIASLKKQIVKMNPNQQKMGLANELIQKRTQAINQQHRNFYDAI